jgi:serine/threonine-protein kinase
MSAIDRLNAALTGRYEIERELGAGGMATVYLARDLKHNRNVALKVLKPELAAVLGAERFVVEIKTTAALQHPHILPLFDSGNADSFLFYVMPFIDGETLREKLNRETQLGVDEAVRIAREVLDALEYAHQHGIVHRDIKPENILLHGGHAMVADFGIALAVSAAAGGRMTETGLSLGTPHYMSPEQATAEKEITARSDVYSLGSVLYEMLSGEPPHMGNSAQQIIMKIIAEPVKPVTQLRKSVPPNVAAAVAKSLEKLPADRFESAKAFGDALGNPAYANASAAGTAGYAMAGRRGVSMRLFAATATIAAVAIAGLVWSVRCPAPSREITRLSVQLPDSQGLSGIPARHRLAVSPDGRTIVYVGPGASTTQTRLWVRHLDELRAAPLAGTDGAFNPAFSPDGKRVAFVSGAPRAIKWIALAGGAVTQLTDSLVDAGGLTWSSDGYLYYDGHLSGDGLARIRDSGGKPEIVTRADSGSGERYHFHPSALPNGRGVLFVVAHSGGPATFDVTVLDSRNGKYRVLARGVAGQYAESGHLVYVTTEGTLIAAPFDLDRLALTGDAVTIASGLAVRAQGTIDLGISRNGLLTYALGSAQASRRELVWLTREGAETPVDTQWTGDFINRIALSPDGKWLAAGFRSTSASPDIWTKQLDRGAPQKIAAPGYGPTWSPDGRTIAYLIQAALMTVPADGSALPSKLRAEDLASGLQYTHDGKWIVYSAHADLFAVRIDGDTTRRELVTGPAIETNPAVSADGRWLAYQSDETGRFEVYVRPFPDTKPMKRQVSVGGGSFPRWSKDGRELFFVDEKLDFIVVPVIPGPVFKTDSPRRLFRQERYAGAGGQFDISPDARRFITTRPVGAVTQRPDELIVVQNFFEELRAMAPVKR